VEHLMAALHAMGCHDALVQVDGPELPALDGSALAYVEAIERTGLAEQDAFVDLLAPNHIHHVVQGESEAWVFPWHVLAVTVIVDYPDTAAGLQAISMEIDPHVFAREIAPARTFALEAELEAIKQAGLARGGGPENAFLIGREEYSGPLRFPDEVVRHKALDLIGDLYLAGVPVCAHVVATKPGHALNVSLAAALRSAADAGAHCP
jgi:UDP-3-O-[3-hydroxymyristoyl] N-acetylglucosamine deacetylase